MHFPDIFFEIHSDNPREGPGDNESTRKALSFVTDLPAEPLILDIGCGLGMQTILLAQETNGRIIAIDTHQPYLNVLGKNAKEKGLDNRIETKLMSMYDLNFSKNTFDLIWSEGAIYIIGVRKGLRKWKKYLRDKAYLVFTEISWLRDDIPEDLRNFWEESYPDIKNISENIKIIGDTGYQMIHHFILPESSWFTHYYAPIEEKLAKLEVKYENDKKNLEVIKAEKDEIAMFRKYSKYYGYVFYIIMK